MFKAERLEKIKALVSERRQVDVSGLSAQLNVTEVTIRSDLEQLEKEGFLKRLHGGAVLNEENSALRDREGFFQSQNIEYNEGKAAAALVAAALVEEKECIFLGPGETCYYIAKELLPRKRLTVLTNNLYVADVLSANESIALTLTGGQVVRGCYCVADDKFRAMTADLYLTKAFFSAAGVNASSGYTVAASYEVAVCNEILTRSREAVMVADSAKFDRTSFVKLGGLDRFRTVVTDKEPPDLYLNCFRQNGVDLLRNKG